MSEDTGAVLRVMSVQGADSSKHERDGSILATTEVKLRRESKCCSPLHWFYRYYVLALVCVVKVCLYYALDSPAGLENTIIQTMKIDVTRYSLFNAVYFWPTIVTTFLGGILVDRFLGLRLGAVIFAGIACSGQLMFAIGGMFDSYMTMVVARFFCGITCDIALAVTDAIAAVWFKGKELTFMVAILGFGSRLGGTLTLFSNQFIYEQLGYISSTHIRLGTTLMVPFLLSLVSFVAALVLHYVDKRGARIIRRLVTTRRPFRLKDIKEFGAPYWLFTLSTATFYSTLFPFVGIAQVFFIRKYGLPINMVSLSETLIYLTALVSPASGAIINWTGYNLYWSLGGLHLTMIVHLLFLLSNRLYYLPFVGSALFGFSHSIYNTAMWGAPAFLVSEQQLATAYGLCQSINSIGFTISDIIGGYLIDYHGYFSQELLFVIYIAVSIATVWWMVFSLSGKNHPFNMSNSQRKKLAGKITINPVRDVGDSTASLSSSDESLLSD